ncbi:MAG: hypothetical protein IPK50_17110 [Fibrobacterota bacterium]|nr:MAG: hypothetical protein IPK50_17110 [Fibrobacterota bacterium]
MNWFKRIKLAPRILLAPIGVLVLFSASVLVVVRHLGTVTESVQHYSRLSGMDHLAQSSSAATYKGLSWANAGFPAKRIDSLFTSNLTDLDSLQRPSRNNPPRAIRTRGRPRRKPTRSCRSIARWSRRSRRSPPATWDSPACIWERQKNVSARWTPLSGGRWKEIACK